MNAQEKRELLRTAARTLLAHRDAGRMCDLHSIKWAEQVLANNPQPFNEASDSAAPQRSQQINKKEP